MCGNLLSIYIPPNPNISTTTTHPRHLAPFLLFLLFSARRDTGLPYIRLIPKVTAVSGEILNLKCPVAGYPIEEIHWERGGRELPDDIRQRVQPDGSLTISPVQKASDSGVYTCWARNKQGHSARRSGEVTVIG